MTQTVQLPLWLFVLIVLFAAVTALSHFLLPSVRWFFRRRFERAVARLNTRLKRPIQPFKLARRHDMIQRLIYDPEVSREIAEYAEQNKVPENVAFQKAREYAREIVPSFQRIRLFQLCHAGGQAAGGSRLPHPDRTAERRDLWRDPQGCHGGLRDEPPQQHGLRAGDLSGLQDLHAQLCGGGMGAGLAAVAR